jgi:hypothetical protein
MESGFGAPAHLPKEAKTRWRSYFAAGADQIHSAQITTSVFSADFTICAWVWTPALHDGVIFDASSEDGTQYVRLSITSSGSLTFDQSGSSLSTGNVLSANRWHFVAAVRTGTTLFLYYDAIAHGSTLTLGSSATVTRFGAGAEVVSPTDYFTGTISRLALFNSAVSFSNIQAMNAQRFSAWAVAPAHTWFTREFNTRYAGVSTLGLDQAGNVDLSVRVGLTLASAVDEFTKTYGASVIDSVTGSDWGFGDPTPSDPSVYARDTGFGSPTVDLYEGNVQILAPLGKYGDDGAYTVEVLADWPIEGPYRFRLIDGTDKYPADTFAYSGVPGQLYRCYSYTGGVDIIRFALPVAPPATYDLQIEWGPNYGQKVLVPGLDIIRRNRRRHTYAVRRSFPPIYKVGPVTVKAEEAL